MIRMKIAFVLRLINDFSGNCIKEKGFTFVINDRVVHPVVKEEGLYVFLEPMENNTRVVIESPFYHSCSVTIDKKTLDPQEPVAEVRLYEKAGKQISRTAGILTGILDKCKNYPTEVYAKKSSSLGLTVREYRNIEGEHWIFFSGFTKESILGKTWLLDDFENPTVVILQEKRGINEYRAEIVCGKIEKIRSGTPIFRVYRSVTDRFGAYAIPVESGEETKILEVVALHENKKINKEGD